MKKLIAISDLHFGHNKVPTEHIYRKLIKYFFPILNEPLFLTINGDIFDRNLSLSNPDTSIIIDFFIQLYGILEQHNSILRIVRGTYQHDRNQIKVLEKLYYTRKYTFNFKYIDTIDIEIFSSLNNLKILYLPDDLPFNSTEDVISHIKSKLTQLQLKNVDYIFGHGNFKHTFPPGLLSYPKITFTEDSFKDIVDKLILFGHVHVPSTYKNIIYSGSFDRLCHGESSKKKGYIVIKDFLTNQYKIEFIENKDATPFIDIKWNENIDKFLELVNNTISKLVKTEYSDLVYVRLIDIPPEYKYTIITYIKEHFSNTIFTFYTSKHLKMINQFHEIKKSTFDEYTLSSTSSFSLKDIINYTQKQLEKKFNLVLDINELQSYFQF